MAAAEIHRVHRPHGDQAFQPDAIPMFCRAGMPALLSFLPAGSTNPIPEPGSIVLLGSGFSTAAYLLRRRRFGRVRG